MCSLLLVRCWDYQSLLYQTLQLTGAVSHEHELYSRITTVKKRLYQLHFVFHLSNIMILNNSNRKSVSKYIQAGNMEAVESFLFWSYKRIIRFMIHWTTNGISTWAFCDRSGCIPLWKPANRGFIFLWCNASRTIFRVGFMSTNPLSPKCWGQREKHSPKCCCKVHYWM
jgi:hypothetical protein